MPSFVSRRREYSRTEAVFPILMIAFAFRTTNEANFRTSAYEAITSYVAHASADVIPVVQNTLITILVRMEQLLGMQVCGVSVSTSLVSYGVRTKLSASMIVTTGMSYRATCVVS